ncbi:MAG: 16S rRNA (guanine(527)-N(7))-methyltransferase RsmG [candidate division KSB1 bacterium]|nr:16S rRNA (guanine(527)-N(7))-methyltransferase RsmG [candidate division KSB1 bacterium]
MKHRKHVLSNDYLKRQIAFLKQRLESNGLKLTPEQQNQFQLYIETLVQWNQRINLISKGDETKIAQRHFLESVGLLWLISFPSDSRILDLGTGAGFPGVPLKIVRPDLNLLLLDSNRWKTLFLKELVQTLGLNTIEVVWARAEDNKLKEIYGQKFDWVITRAVAALERLWKWSQPFLQEEGSLIAMKGGPIEKEITRLMNKYPNLQIEEKKYPGSLIEEKVDRKIIWIKIGKEKSER